MNAEPIYLGLDRLNAAGDVGYLDQTGVEETYPLHTHAFMELFLVLRGMAIHSVNGEDQLVQRGSFVLIRPSDAHCYRAFNNYEFRLLSCGFAPHYFDAACAYLHLDANHWLLPPLPRTVELDEETLVHAERLLDSLHPLNGSDRDECFRAILPQLLRCFHLNAYSAVRSIPAWLSALMHKMSERENFTAGLPRMLDMAGCTQEHLTRAFRRHIGLTPTQFINRKRIEYAAELLQTTDLSILDICYACGFGGPSNFYDCFQHIYGVPPSRFARQRQQ